MAWVPCLSTSTGLLAVASPGSGEQGVAELLGLAQAHQLLALAGGGEPPGRDADDEQHEQGEQVAVAGDAQGEVGGR